MIAAAREEVFVLLLCVLCLLVRVGRGGRLALLPAKKKTENVRESAGESEKQSERKVRESETRRREKSEPSRTAPPSSARPCTAAQTQSSRAESHTRAPRAGCDHKQSVRTGRGITSIRTECVCTRVFSSALTRALSFSVSFKRRCALVWKLTEPDFMLSSLRRLECGV